VTGPTGPTGPTGATGSQGAQGATGPGSVTCYSAYIIARGGRGGSCANVCSTTFTVGPVYTQNAIYTPSSNKYFSNTNCQNSTCDWGGLYSHENFNSDCYTLNATCGNGTFDSVCAYSDVNLKQSIETLEGVMEKILEIETVEYDWNENIGKEKYDIFEKNKKLHQIGLIAQNVRLHFPQVVKMGSDGYYFIDYTKLNAVIVEGIKEQQLFIEDIDNKLEELEKRFS
jgi:hypothetical protein